MGFLAYFFSSFKGSVQQKLRWVEKVLIHGAGHYFFVLIRLHLILTIFPFPVSTAQFIGGF
jgi:hypothetical protein